VCVIFVGYCSSKAMKLLLNIYIVVLELDVQYLQMKMRAAVHSDGSLIFVEWFAPESLEEIPEINQTRTA
jgi:hypothetical protein